MNNLIEIPIQKGCILFLTPEEYERAIKRGKGIRRSRTFKERQEKRAESNNNDR